MRKKIRESTLWPDRDATSRPTVTIGLSLTTGPVGRGVWLEKGGP